MRVLKVMIHATPLSQSPTYNVQGPILPFSFCPQIRLSLETKAMTVGTRHMCLDNPIPIPLALPPLPSTEPSTSVMIPSAY